METWFFYAMISAILWGVGQVVVKKGHSTFTPLGDNIFATIFQVFIIAPFIVFFLGVDFNKLLPTLPFAFLVATLYMTYYYVITQGQVSLTATVLSAYPVVTVILSVTVLDERLSFLQLCAAILIVLGTVVLALPEKISKQAFRHPQKWILWGIFGAVMVGCVQVLTKVGAEQSDGNTFTFLMGLSYIPALLICAIFDKKGRNLKSIKWNKSIIISLIGVAMIETQLIPLNLAFATGPASLVSLISSTNVIFMIVLALLFLKERINKIQFFGIFLTVAGILLINW